MHPAGSQPAGTAHGDSIPEGVGTPLSTLKLGVPPIQFSFLKKKDEGN